MSLEQRVDRIEDTILVMKDLLVSHNERLGDYFRAMNEFREEFQFKMNAVINAQLKNETEIAELKDSIIELRKSTTELKEASQSQLHRIERLENG
jgi:methyl-accepting chemotaxis protein